MVFQHAFVSIELLYCHECMMLRVSVELAIGYDSFAMMEIVISPLFVATREAFGGSYDEAAKVVVELRGSRDVFGFRTRKR